MGDTTPAEREAGKGHRREAGVCLQMGDRALQGGGCVSKGWAC